MYVFTPRFKWRVAGIAVSVGALVALACFAVRLLHCEFPVPNPVAMPLVVPARAPASCSYCTEPLDRCEACVAVTQNPLLIANASGDASTTLQMCNKGMDESLALAVSAFNVPAPASGVYGLSPPQPTLAAVSAAERSIVEGQAPLARTRCVPLKISAAGLLEQGVHTAQLSLGDRSLATLKAVRVKFPFALQGGEPRIDRIDASAGPGRPLVLPIYNRDPHTYTFEWRLELGDGVDRGVKTVAGHDRVDLWPNPTLLSTGWAESGFLRSGARTGKLYLRHAPDPSFVALDTATKSLDVGVTLACFGPDKQRLVNTAAILVVLLAGIGVSLLLNYAWPMYRRKFAIKRRLALQDGRLAGIGRVVPARLLSLMRIEKRRLREELRSRGAWDPETEAALAAIEPRVEALGRRIELTARAGEVLKSIEGDPLLSQHEFDEAERHARVVLQVACMGTAGAADLARADAALASAMAVPLQRDSDPPATLVEALRTRADAVNAHLDEATVAQSLDEGLRSLLGDAKGGLRKLFLVEQETAPSRLRFVDAANAVAKAEAILTFADLVGSSDPKVREARLARAGDLLAALNPGPDAAMRLGPARAVLDEIEQNVTRADVVAAVRDAKPGELTIEVDPPTPRDYQLVMFRVHLPQPGLDEAVARGQVRWTWSIDGQPIGNGPDWVAWHFFEPQPAGDRFERWLAKWVRRVGDKAGTARPFSVEASATDGDESGQAIATVQRQDLLVEGTKTYAENAMMVAIFGLVITVLLAGIALVATAQDRIQSLDWMTGTVVVFGLGFAADVLKRAVQRS